MTLRFLIYGLGDPFTDELRYVGKSSSGLARPRKHIAITESPTTHKQRWVNKVMRANGRPEIHVLEEFACQSELDEAERFWIAYWKFIGGNLTNATDGGDGCDRNAMRNPEALARYSLANKGRRLTPEHRARIAAGNRRRYEDPEQRAQNAGDRNPAKRPDVGAKISAKNKGIKRPHLAEFNRQRAKAQREARQLGQAKLPI